MGRRPTESRAMGLCPLQVTGPRPGAPGPGSQGMPPPKPLPSPAGCRAPPGSRRRTWTAPSRPRPRAAPGRSCTGRGKGGQEGVTTGDATEKGGQVKLEHTPNHQPGHTLMRLSSMCMHISLNAFQVMDTPWREVGREGRCSIGEGLGWTMPKPGVQGPRTEGRGPQALAAKAKGRAHLGLAGVGVPAAPQPQHARPVAQQELGGTGNGWGRARQPR